MHFQDETGSYNMCCAVHTYLVYIKDYDKKNKQKTKMLLQETEKENQTSYMKSTEKK